MRQRHLRGRHCKLHVRMHSGIHGPKLLHWYGSHQFGRPMFSCFDRAIIKMLDLRTFGAVMPVSRVLYEGYADSPWLPSTVDIDECAAADNPCNQNSTQGVCDDGINTYTCSCRSGFTGTACETSKWPSTPTPAALASVAPPAKPVSGLLHLLLPLWLQWHRLRNQ